MKTGIQGSYIIDIKERLYWGHATDVLGSISTMIPQAQHMLQTLF